MYKKGQAAMEFLMTYGWAILVIVIVIGVLAFFLPQQTRVPETCIADVGFTCKNPQIYLHEDYVNVALRLTNGQQTSLKDVKAICVLNPQYANEDSANDVADSVSPGQEMALEDIPCVDENGDKISRASGSDFKGYVVVFYKAEGDVKDIYRTAKVSITGTVGGTAQ